MNSVQDRYIVRRVMDRLLNRLPVTKSTRLFTTKEAAEAAREGARYSLHRYAVSWNSPVFTPVRKYSGGLWGYDVEE